MGSDKFNISVFELEKFLRNSLFFLAPLLIIYLTFVAANINVDGFQPSDFTPTNEVIGAIILYVLNVILDFLRKYVPDTKNYVTDTKNNG